MAGTRPCPACGHQVARSASPFNCPGCGLLIRFGDLDTPEERARNRKGCLILLGLVLLAFLIMYILGVIEQSRH